jgi:hypothetical protein
MHNGISRDRQGYRVPSGLRDVKAARSEPRTEKLPEERLHLDSKEFKMQLDPKRFKDVDQAISKFRARVEEAFDENGVKIDRPKKDEVRTQEIIFLDTEDHSLREQGYILRYRDVEGGWEHDNLTLKVRDVDPEKVMDADVQSAEGYKSKTKLELDESFQEVTSHVYSKSNKVKLPRLPKKPTVEAIAEIFPALGELGIDGSARLRNVHEGGITEERHLLGNVRVNEFETAPAYLTLWYDEEHQKTPAVAEFSFAHPAHSEGTGEDKRSEELMQTLQDSAPKWILRDGSTKTNYAYND